MSIHLTKILFSTLIILIGVILVIINPPILRVESNTTVPIIKAIAAILVSSTLLLFLFATQSRIADNFKWMALISVIILAFFIWVGRTYLNIIDNNTCSCNGGKVLIGTKLSYSSDSIYSCKQLLYKRGCIAEGIWEPQSFVNPEKNVKKIYLFVYPLLVLSLLSISQSVFALNPIKNLLMRLFTKKVSCKRFYETKSRTIDITGLKTGVPQKFDLGVASFKINTKYQDASERLKTLDLLQYGLCNDINGVSDLKQRDRLLKKIIETKTKMLEIVLELSSDTKQNP